MSTIESITCRLLDVAETVLIKTLLFGNFSVDAHTVDKKVLNGTIEYIYLTTKKI